MLDNVWKKQMFNVNVNKPKQTWHLSVSHCGRFIYNWPTSGPSCVCVCVCVCTSVKAIIVHPMAISTLPQWGRSKLICLTHTHTQFHITAELIKHNVTGWEQDWGKRRVCACGGISRGARWERDREVNSDSSDAEKRGRERRREVENLSRNKNRAKAVTKVNRKEKSLYSIYEFVGYVYI